jgi:hAT family protein
VQSDQCRLHEVLMAFASIMRAIKHPAFRTGLSDDALQRFEWRLDRRFAQWNSKLLIVAVYLNPHFRLKPFNPAIVRFQDVFDWCHELCGAFFEGMDVSGLFSELLDYHEAVRPFAEAKVALYAVSPLGYWVRYAASYYPIISALAGRLLSISISSAAVERLFSEMGRIHTPARNRLHEQKVLAMCQIRSQLRREERAHELREEMVQRERAEAASEARRRMKDQDRAGSQPGPSDASSTPALQLVEVPKTTTGDADQDEEELSVQLQSMDEWMEDIEQELEGMDRSIADDATPSPTMRLTDLFSASFLEEQAAP